MATFRPSMQRDHVRSSLVYTLDMSEQDDLEARSGNITYDSKLVGFLYDLLRDHLTAGVVEKLVQESQVSEVSYSNGWLAQYAKDLAERLTSSQVLPLDPKSLLNGH